MVPSAIVVLEALPLTPNHKVDRRALPEPDWEPLAAYEAPVGRETAVAEAFAVVLERARVGAGDDFFALGGHSLLATRVISRLRAALGVEVPLRSLFEAPTVRGLAARIAALDPVHAPPPGDPGARARAPPGVLRSDASLVPRPSRSRQRGLQPPSSVRMEGALDVAILARALSEIVRRHEPLRTRFEEGPGGLEAIVDPPSELALRLVDLTALPVEVRASRASSLTCAEAREPFDLARGPLLRAVLLRLADTDHRLVLTVAHVAADGWSLGILLTELSALYGRTSGGRRARSPSSPWPTPTGPPGSADGSRPGKGTGSSRTGGASSTDFRRCGSRTTVPDPRARAWPGDRSRSR
jgi:acyl carrier protein